MLVHVSVLVPFCSIAGVYICLSVFLLTFGLLANLAIVNSTAVIILEQVFLKKLLFSYSCKSYPMIIMG